MKFVKKYLQPLSLGLAALFGLLVLVFMSGAGYVLKSGNYRYALSVYKCMTHDGGEGSEFGLILALVFTILCIVIALVLAAVALLGKELSFAKWLQLGAAVLSLVCVILFFLTVAMIESDSSLKMGQLGVGAVFAAIFSLLNVCLFACAPVMELIKK